MIPVSTATRDLLKKGYSISTSAGATIEYNLNSMVENVSATSDAMTNNYSVAFKKLFPIDTIYKPFRPLSPGIKYLVHTTNSTDTPKDSFENPRDVSLGTKPRLYYPGPDIVYKYWLAPKDTNINISVNYFVDDTVTSEPKIIPVNKIIARFETNHDKPTSWTITGVKPDNTTISVTGTTLNSNGEAVIYYNGSTWSTTEPATYTTTQNLKRISLSAVNSKTGKFIGVIEFSPRWVINIDSDIMSFLVNKETTSDDTSIVPVGIITANYLNMFISKPHTTSRSIVEYDRNATIDSTKIYLLKNALIKPYINVGDGATSQKVPQGSFYVNTWSLSEFGEASIDATDAAKILQDTLCPQLLVQDSPITSIIKRILDSIGFSTYKINVKTVDGKVDDDSIPSLSYWWSDGDKTVWDVLQELCRDIQMNAFVDEYNTLNFYSRNFIYDKTREPSWTFTSENINVNSVLDYAPNIQSLSTKELFSANQVRVRYSTAFTASNTESSSPLWKSDTSFLGAGALTKKIDLSSTDFSLQPSVVNSDRTDRILDQFSGYVLINGEIIEYDGVYYQYVPVNGTTPIEVLIRSQSDIWKYSALAKPGYKNFQPTNRYSIKTRGALSTSKSVHEVAPDSYINKAGENDTNKFNKYSITLATPDIAKDKPGSGNYFIPTGSTSKGIRKGFLAISNLDQNKKSFDIAIKKFESIAPSGPYFSFGTRMFFESQLNTPEQVGGIGFCLDSDGKNGYYLLVRTTAYAELQKDIMLVKVQNGRLTVLKDSQQSSTKTLAGIYAGVSYNIDILLKPSDPLPGGAFKNIITVFINGYKITAVDSGYDGPSIYVPPISITKNVGVHCGQGVAYFEYLYAKTIPQAVYEKNSKAIIYEYNGVYSDDTVSMLYGDIIYNDGESVSDNTGPVFEFGTTAREIKKTKISYEDRPAIPITFRTSLNKYVTVLDQRLQPFGAESYVLNNTSTTVALDDNNNTSFYVLGNSIQRSGVIDYDTDQSTDSSNKESVVFDSVWIQREQDAKSLAEWIKTNVLNKGRFVDMTVFGNPIISAGDIVRINYPILGMDTVTNKYIVTKCTLEYREGLTTTIACRAI